MSNPATKLTRKQQWSENAKKRRQRVLDAGGHVVSLLLDEAEWSQLQAIVAERKTSLLDWVRAAITRDARLLRLHRPPKADRSNAPATHPGAHSTPDAPPGQ